MKTTKLLVETALLTAVIFVATRFIQIPIPLGYFTFANAIILTCCLRLPKAEGIFASAVGSALADFTSFAVYTIPTLVIKGLMPFVFYVLFENGHKKSASWIAFLIPLIGYTIVGGIIEGNMKVGLAQFPGLFVEYLVNGAIFFAIQKNFAK